MANKFFSVIILIIGLLFLSGCLSKKEVDLTQKKVLPSWYANPPQTTPATLYATGEGEDRDDAVANALSMMASTLSVSIASQFSSKKVVKEGLENSISSTVSNEVQSDVKKIRISHYEILNSWELGFKKYIVLIKSDKQKLFESMKNELEQKFAFIESEIKQSQKYNALEQLNSYKKAKADTNDVPNILTVMNVLNGTFDAREYIGKMEMIESRYGTLLASITVSIECDAESKNLEAPIREGLGLKKVQIKNGSGEKHFYITVSSNIQKASSYGFALARSAIEITVKDYKNSVIGSKKLNITGQSTQGYEIAKESVAVKFGEMIKKEGVGKVLGLDL
ncbi:MAG: LPP20 family lipoprotein [Sulfurimonas sp.]|uniref:LPP20 family lipoprotein n=1 Tax=Sulfurimonas sp. TaxID=2022749 RepID=UPI002622C83B|nr:LPP20 family lipoprotein [Sulfurimonas sp.]MDD5373631.1 LPP20 family lipoprotein [Sulfurimonas sp.]